MFQNLKETILRNYKFLFPLIVIVSMHLFSFPQYALLSPDNKIRPEECNMQQKIDRKDHLFETVSDKYSSETHMAKTEFRLTGPFLAKVFHIGSKRAMYLLQLIAGYLFFFILTGVIFKMTADKVVTLFYTLAFSLLYPGFSFVAEMMGYFDSFAFLFLLVAMLDINIGFIILSLFLAFWTDERAIMAGMLVAFWGQYQQYIQKQKNFYMPSKHALAYVGTVLAYIICRWYLLSHLGFKNQFNGTGIHFISNTFRYIGMDIWQSFEGFWIIVVIAFYTLYTKKRWDIMLIFIAINIILFGVAHNVLDLTRSISYMFPSIIIATLIAKENLESKQLRQVICIALLFTFMYPCMSIIAGGPPHIYYSLPMQLVKKLLHVA